MTAARPDRVKDLEAVDAATPSGPGRTVGPAGSSSGAPAAGAGSSGRVGRTYVPAPDVPEQLDAAEQPLAAERSDEADGPRASDELGPADEIAHRPGPPLTTAPPQRHAYGAGSPAVVPQSGRSAPSVSGRPPVAPSPAAASPRPRSGIRRARLRLTRIDPWSALKVSLVFAAILFVVWMVAVLVLFTILQGAGVFDSVNSTLTDVFGAHVDFSGALILGGAAVIGALSVVITTALGTVVAFAYNVTASLLGGLDVTLTEQE